MNPNRVSTAAGAAASRQRSVARYWDELLTVGLLGTDRRDVPPAPPGALADLAADDPQPSPSARLLQQVAACTAARRAGIVPAAASAPLDPAPADARPPTPPAATFTWRQIVADWPVLEDEWLLTVIANGWRLAPELVARILARHRTDGPRRGRALLAAGPLADWLIAQQPYLAVKPSGRTDPAAVAGLPELAITPQLQPLLLAAPADAAGALASTPFSPADRAVHVNLLARIRPDSLAPVADALRRVAGDSPSAGIALSLADLAQLRHRMLTELEFIVA